MRHFLLLLPVFILSKPYFEGCKCELEDKTHVWAFCTCNQNVEYAVSRLDFQLMLQKGVSSAPNFSITIKDKDELISAIKQCNASLLEEDIKGNVYIESSCVTERDQSKLQ
uniref:Secreted protein n=1 Tax=Rhabditophanes sp. KR3021 TaxID=114890 RepID=A0AC35U1H1_9BILA